MRRGGEEVRSHVHNYLCRGCTNNSGKEELMQKGDKYGMRGKNHRRWITVRDRQRQRERERGGGERDRSRNSHWQGGRGYFGAD